MKLDRDELIEMLREKPRHERIALMRSLFGLSQSQLAEVAGVYRGTVSGWESPIHYLQNGRGHEPSKMARERMAAYFNLPTIVFMDDWGKEDLPRTRRAARKNAERSGQIYQIPNPPEKRESKDPPDGVTRIG